MQQARRYGPSVAAVVIKKYGNRRLYDTGDSKYVTLDELAAKIRAGHDLRIVDAQSGEDLTQATLTQLVLETGQAAKFLPVQLLTQMIRLSDDALAEFFSRYVTGALDLYLQAKRGAQTLVAYNPLTQLPAAAGDALTRMWMANPFAGQYQAPPPYAGYPQPSPPGFSPAPPPELDPDHDQPVDGDRADDDRNDVALMRRELDELKQAIRDGMTSKLGKPSKSGKSKKS